MKHMAVVAYGGGEEDYAVLHATEEIGGLLNRTHHHRVFGPGLAPPEVGLWIAEISEMPGAVFDHIDVVWRKPTNGEAALISAGENPLQQDECRRCSRWRQSGYFASTTCGWCTLKMCAREETAWCLSWRER